MVFYYKQVVRLIKKHSLINVFLSSLINVPYCIYSIEFIHYLLKYLHFALLMTQLL